MIRSIEFRAMNTEVLLAAEGEGAVQGMQVVMAFTHDCEQRFSRFLPGSEVSALNQGAGEWFYASDDLIEMIELALKYHAGTGGLFDPGILPDLKRIGYDRSMDLIRAEGPGPVSSSSNRQHRPAFRDIKINPLKRMVLLPPGLQIDLTGIAKGWIVEKAARLLNTHAATCAVSAGGDALFIGRPSDGSDWAVHLEDPRDPSFMLAQLHLESGAVATSSIMKRAWRQGEANRHHLIDPRSGEPAKTDWLSVTVIARDVITADVFAKAILIGGERAAQTLPGMQPGLAFITVDPDGNLQGSENYKEFIYESAAITRQSVDAAY